MMNRSYEGLISIDSFQDRFDYLRMRGMIGDQTFGGRRYLNQRLYQSAEWKQVRRDVIIRDNGCDLAHPDYPIYGKIYIHHIEPITPDDIYRGTRVVFDPNNLVCVSFDTHNAIHYGDGTLLQKEYVERTKNDTCPWR